MVDPRRAVVALSFVSMVLAGCAGGADNKTDAAGGPGDDPSSTLPPVDPGLGAPDGSTPPVWQIGDWWDYQVDYASGESYGAKIIVYAEDATSYYITSDTPDLILRSAITHYPTLGKVDKATFNEYIHGTEVSFLEFPMENGTRTGQFRDFPATWTTVSTTLESGKGPVPGFATVLRNADDGLPRMRYGWSPVTKWFTNVTFDFDGVGEVDVAYTLRDRGSNHTGTFPVLEIVEGVHRVFPTVALPTDPAAPPPGPPGTDPAPNDAITIANPGSDILWAMFAGAGGAGEFEVTLHPAGPGYEYSWRPTSAGSNFHWATIPDAPAGDWTIAASGTAQVFAFLFVEVYEVRRASMTLP